MGNQRLGAWLAVGCLVAGAGIAAAQPAKSGVTPQVMLAYRPKQDAVTMTNPTEAELAVCKVEVIKGTNNTSAYILRDGRGQILRRFADTRGTGKVDTKSYYLEGQEVYREIDGPSKQVPEQYRWFGAGGMRWGVDVNGDGAIDAWQQISAEEASQEILRAVATKNLARLEALVLSERELKALELPAAEQARIRDSIAKIPAQFQATCAKLSKLNDKVRWQHLETQPPQCVPADLTGGKYDLVRYTSATILFQMGDKDHDWLQTGELIQVGRTWRLVSAPIPGHAAAQSSSAVADAGQIDFSDEALKGLIEKLQEIDKRAASTSGTNAEAVRYNLDRSVVLEQIVARMKPQAADQWIRQVADCYSAAAQNSGPTEDLAYRKLTDLGNRIAKAQPGSPLAGYVAYREIQAEYAMKLSRPGGKPDDLGKVQEGLRDRLRKFAEEYGTAEDVPDALLQLGMVSEFMNKETDAKGYYALMVKNHAQHPLATKAQGALKRLTSDGQIMTLSGPTLGSGQTFSMGSLNGKIVVVYYWASWNQQCPADFLKLQALANTYASKGLEIVCVSLDNTAADASGFVQKTGAPGTHLYQAGGLDSPLAVQYGVMVLPNMFLVGRDGKVVSHTIQMNSLEDEVKKLTEK
ncbi:MAG TPA: thioredoxin-like domain-containing protein [Gemmataceae bacterium]|nr:thioredoxin-like domain-containing protein [Gemmataceae bacterium]